MLSLFISTFKPYFSSIQLDLKKNCNFKLKIICTKHLLISTNKFTRFRTWIWDSFYCLAHIQNHWKNWMNCWTFRLSDIWMVYEDLSRIVPVQNMVELLHTKFVRLKSRIIDLWCNWVGLTLGQGHFVKWISDTMNTTI